MNGHPQTTSTNSQSENQKGGSEMMKLRIQGMNFSKHIEINKNLTIDNLRATIGMECQKEVALEVVNGETQSNEEL